jgi:exopolysaccharide production protein ExoY
VRHSANKLNYSGRGAPGSQARATLGGISKRAVDVVFGSLALVLLTPLLVATGLLVRLLIGKPIIVAEESVGLGGKVFALYKFRTTPGDATRASEWTEIIAQALRASRIDKLPQLYNIIRGDMSLVGPEAVEPRRALYYGIQVPEILLARPGLIGMRHYVPRGLSAPIAERGLDRLYILRWSLWLDLRIVCGALARIHAQDASRPAK